MLEPVRITLPGSNQRLRDHRLGVVSRGVPSSPVALQVICAEALASCPLYCSQPNCVEANVGGGWVPLSNDPDAGLELGPLPAGVRVDFEARYNSNTVMRDDFPQLMLDRGI